MTIKRSSDSTSIDEFDGPGRSPIHRREIKGTEPGIRTAAQSHVVFVVDDDPGMRSGVVDLLNIAGHSAVGFADAVSARDAASADAPSCFVVDVRMRGMDGLTLQRELVALGTPVILMTGHADVAMGVNAIKAGAYDFLTKPFREQDLLDAVAGALRKEAWDRPRREEMLRVQSIGTRLNLKEVEILTAIGDGRSNKLIARDRGVSEVTIKVYRARIMRKLGATSAAHLVRMAIKLGLLDRPGG